jgi:hypothetical protein
MHAVLETAPLSVLKLPVDTGHRQSASATQSCRQRLSAIPQYLSSLVCSRVCPARESSHRSSQAFVLCAFTIESETAELPWLLSLLPRGTPPHCFPTGDTGSTRFGIRCTIYSTCSYPNHDCCIVIKNRPPVRKAQWTCRRIRRAYSQRRNHGSQAGAPR